MEKPTLGVGESCRYYQRGDTKRPPVAAIVTSSDHSGVLDLVIFQRGGRNVIPVTGVRHRDDPFLEDHTAIAFDNGVWDYLPRKEKTEGVDLDVVAVAIIERFGGPQKFVESFQATWAENKVFELAAKYGDGSGTKIAEEMTTLTGEEWPYQKVNAILRKRQK